MFYTFSELDTQDYATEFFREISKISLWVSLEGENTKNPK